MSDNEGTGSTGEDSLEVEVEVEEVTTAGRNWKFYDHLKMFEQIRSGADLWPKMSPRWTALSNETLGLKSGQAFQRQLTASIVSFFFPY